MTRISHAYEFDVFLSYNRRDRKAAERLATALHEGGLKVFKDKWYLRPGDYWPRVLEKRLTTSAAIVILCGGYGLGPWQQREAVAALDLQDRAEKAGNPAPPVIPVLLEPHSDQRAGLQFLNSVIYTRRISGLFDRPSADHPKWTNRPVIPNWI